MWRYEDGTIIEVGKAWTDAEGYQHPANWCEAWSDEDKKKWGLTFTAVEKPKTFDDRFYFNADSPRPLADSDRVDADGNKMKDADGNQLISYGLKSTWIAKKKAEANFLLSKTDWYIVRKTEVDVAIPSNVTSDRAAIRSAMAALETKITNASDLDAFMALFATSKDGDGNTVKSDMDCF